MIKRLLDAVFPYILVCVVCGVEKGVSTYLCPACASQMAQLAAGQTDVFGYAAFSPYQYDGAAAQIIQTYKYGGSRWLCAFMAQSVAQCVCAAQLKPSCVCHVPLHDKKRRKRGFDQAALLAQNVAQLLGKPYTPALLRVRNTPSQTKLTSKERLENVQGAFDPTMAVSGHVLLIDDVLTTGATAAECARVLKEAGAESVSIATFAQAVFKDSRT